MHITYICNMKNKTTEMLQNVIDETGFYIFYMLSSSSTDYNYRQLIVKVSDRTFWCFNFHQHIDEFFLVPIQVKTTITRYQPLINRTGRNSLSIGPSHAISIKSCIFSWTREFLNNILILSIEGNCFSHSVVDGQRIKEKTQLLSYQKLHIIPSLKYQYS